ncbi:MAG TPA: CcmD family protein [Anaerolineae bacterium]|nr:CcmD family protein [Anaerolineae bacterium]
MLFNLILPLIILLQTDIDNPNRFNQYLVLGYFVIWLIGFLYVVSLYNRQRNLEQDLELLQQLIDEEM